MTIQEEIKLTITTWAVAVCILVSGDVIAVVFYLDSNHKKEMQEIHTLELKIDSLKNKIIHE